MQTRWANSDVRTILGLAEAIAQATTLEDLLAVALEHLAALVPCDVMSFGRMSPEGKLASMEVPTGTCTPALHAVLEAHLGQRPLVALTRVGDGRVHRRGDAIAWRCFRKIPLGTDFYGRLGLEYELAVTVGPSASPFILAMDRASQDFTDREVALVDLVSPMLSRALSRLDRRRPRLTQREREVLSVLAQGWTNREIGSELGISHRTVQRHLARVFDALGADTRTAAVTRALALGIVRA